MAQQQGATRISNDDRSAATRAALVGAARELFAEHGYAAVAINQVVERAGVTRGALYHHFTDKRDLFRAVFEETEAAVVPRIAERLAAGEGEDLWTIALSGSAAFLEICLEPDFQQIAVIDAPAVLGTAEQHEIADAHGGALLTATIRAMIEAGEIAPLPVETLAQIVTGALVAGAGVIARAEDQAQARREVGEAVEALLRGLATS